MKTRTFHVPCSSIDWLSVIRSAKRGRGFASGLFGKNRPSASVNRDDE